MTLEQNHLQSTNQPKEKFKGFDLLSKFKCFGSFQLKWFSKSITINGIYLFIYLASKLFCMWIKSQKRRRKPFDSILCSESSRGDEDLRSERSGCLTDKPLAWDAELITAGQPCSCSKCGPQWSWEARHSLPSFPSRDPGVYVHDSASLARAFITAYWRTWLMDKEQWLVWHLLTGKGLVPKYFLMTPCVWNTTASCSLKVGFRRPCSGTDLQREPLWTIPPVERESQVIQLWGRLTAESSWEYCFWGLVMKCP